MKNSALAVASLLIIVILAFGGCAAPEPKTSLLPQENQAGATTASADNSNAAGNAQAVAAPAAAGKADAAASTPADASLKQLAKNFYEFDKESYEAALSEGKYVFLDFYANWCPICRAEEPEIKAAFNELSTGNVVGFRVNYNDGDTDDDERALAKKLGVAYQHTKIVVAPDEKVVSRTLRQQSKQEVFDQIKESTAAASQE